MQSTRRTNTIVSFALALTLWLAAGQLAPAAGIEPRSQTALTLTLSQREREPIDIILIQRERGPWNAPSCPLEERLFADAADGRLDQLSPLEAALVAGGIANADSLRHYVQKAATLADELRRSQKLSGEPRQQIKAIFDFLHSRVFTGGYDLAYTDLRRVLDDGRFNCVSATVLFNYLAGQLGLDCRGLETSGHVLSRVRLKVEKQKAPVFIDVENTFTRWNQPPDNLQPQATVESKITGVRRLPIPHAECADYKKTDYKKAREVSPIQLAAMIYYNRGVDLLGEKRFAEAAAANSKALRLDPQNANARKNLLATINNWAIELGNAGRFAQAADLLRQGLVIEPEFAPFAQNYAHVHHQWAAHSNSNSPKNSGK